MNFTQFKSFKPDNVLAPCLNSIVNLLVKGLVLIARCLPRSLSVNCSTLVALIKLLEFKIELIG